MPSDVSETGASLDRVMTCSVNNIIAPGNLTLSGTEPAEARKDVSHLEVEGAGHLNGNKNIRLSIPLIDRLSTELFHDIFLRLADGPISFPPSRSNLKDGPWVLRKVCHRWRGVASSLWNNIHVESTCPQPSLLDYPGIFEASSTEESWHKSVELVQLFSPPDGLVKLSLRVFAETSEAEYNMADFAMRELVLPHESRITRLAFDGSMKAHRAFMRSRRHNYPLVTALILKRSADFCDANYRDVDQTDGVIDITPADFGHFPHLKTLQLSAVDPVISVVAQCIAVLAQLTEFTIGGRADNDSYKLTFEAFSPLLTTCTSLVRLTISGADFQNPNHQIPSMRFPVLEYFDLTFIGDRSNHSYLNLFTLPALTKLRIAATTDEEDNNSAFPLPEIITLLQRSSCANSLKTLVLKVEDALVDDGPLMRFDRQSTRSPVVPPTFANEPSSLEVTVQLLNSRIRSPSSSRVHNLTFVKRLESFFVKTQSREQGAGCGASTRTKPCRGPKNLRAQRSD